MHLALLLHLASGILLTNIAVCIVSLYQKCSEPSDIDKIPRNSLILSVESYTSGGAQPITADFSFIMWIKTTNFVAGTVMSCYNIIHMGVQGEYTGTHGFLSTDS